MCGGRRLTLALFATVLHTTNPVRPLTAPGNTPPYPDPKTSSNLHPTIPQPQTHKPTKHPFPQPIPPYPPTYHPFSLPSGSDNLDTCTERLFPDMHHPSIYRKPEPANRSRNQSLEAAQRTSSVHARETQVDVDVILHFVRGHRAIVWLFIRKGRAILQTLLSTRTARGSEPRKGDPRNIGYPLCVDNSRKSKVSIPIRRVLFVWFLLDFL